MRLDPIFTLRNIYINSNLNHSQNSLAPAETLSSNDPEDCLKKRIDQNKINIIRIFQLSEANCRTNISVRKNK